MKHFAIRRLMKIMLTASVIGTTTHAMAAGFQLWEQDGATMGTYHAGYAALANDASTTWYNPAGITRIHNQQVILGLTAIETNFEYNGNVSLTEFMPDFLTDSLVPVSLTFNNVKANGGVWSYVPNLEYVAPINEDVGFGFSVVVPFGLKTDYGTGSALRYVATLTGITVVDISPALGFKLTDKASLGVGLDIQKAQATFNSVAGFINPLTLAIDTKLDTRSRSHASDTGYGWHFGVLYEFNPDTRIGLSYHSQVAHHFTGKSKFTGPIAGLATVGDSEDKNARIFSRDAVANLMLPAYTVISGFHQFNPCWAIMGTVGYVQWHVFNNLTLQNVAGVVSDFETIIAPSDSIVVTVPEHYKDTWNLSLGAHYYINESFTFRFGVGYDQSPVRDRYRNVQLPDADRYILALGGHYQVTKTVGLDVGWLHVFFNDVNLNPPPQTMGAEVVSTIGKVTGNANLFAGQITWDIV